MEKRGRHRHRGRNRSRNRYRKQCIIGRLSIDAGSAVMPKSIPIAIAIAIPMPIPIPIVPFLRSRRFAWLRPSAALWSLSRTRTPRGGSGRDGDGGSPGLRLADLALRGSSLPVASRLAYLLFYYHKPGSRTGFGRFGENGRTWNKAASGRRSVLLTQSVISNCV